MSKLPNWEPEAASFHNDLILVNDCLDHFSKAWTGIVLQLIHSPAVAIINCQSVLPAARIYTSSFETLKSKDKTILENNPRHWLFQDNCFLTNSISRAKYNTTLPWKYAATLAKTITKVPFQPNDLFICLSQRFTWFWTGKITKRLYQISFPWGRWEDTLSEESCFC